MSTLHCAHSVTFPLRQWLWLVASAAYKCQPVAALIIDPASQGLLLTYCQAWLPFLVYRMLIQDNRLLYLVVPNMQKDWVLVYFRYGPKSSANDLTPVIEQLLAEKQ